jgi:hypothetical protein
MSGVDKNKSTRQDRIRKVQAGFKKHFSKVAQFIFAGIPFTPADLDKLLQSDIEASDAADLDKAKWLATVQKQRAKRDETNPVLRAAKKFVESQFAEAPDAAERLAEFGYSLRKKVVLTAEEKAKRAEKLRATRAARHTMGKRQRKNVKGAVAQPPPDKGAPAPEAHGNGASNGGTNDAPPQPPHRVTVA